MCHECLRRGTRVIIYPCDSMPFYTREKDSLLTRFLSGLHSYTNNHSLNPISITNLFHSFLPLKNRYNRFFLIYGQFMPIALCGAWIRSLCYAKNVCIHLIPGILFKHLQSAVLSWMRAIHSSLTIRLQKNWE